MRSAVRVPPLLSLVDEAWWERATNRLWLQGSRYPFALSRIGVAECSIAGSGGMAGGNDHGGPQTCGHGKRCREHPACRVPRRKATIRAWKGEQHPVRPRCTRAGDWVTVGWDDCQRRLRVSKFTGGSFRCDDRTGAADGLSSWIGVTPVSWTPARRPLPNARVRSFPPVREGGPHRMPTLPLSRELARQGRDPSWLRCAEALAPRCPLRQGPPRLPGMP